MTYLTRVRGSVASRSNGIGNLGEVDVLLGNDDIANGRRLVLPKSLCSTAEISVVTRALEW